MTVQRMWTRDRMTREGIIFPSSWKYAFLAACLGGAVLPIPAHPGLDEQIADLTARLGQDPRNAELYLRRGELHRLHRDWTWAQADYGRAHELAPGMDAVNLAVGTLLLESGKPGAAKPVLDRFLAAHPGHSEALATRARALVALGQNLDAARDFTGALAAAADRSRVDYYLERGRALAAAGDGHLVEALRGLDEGLSELGYPVTLQLFAIDLEVRRGANDAALARVDQIAAHATRKEPWLVRKGEILERAHRPDDALAAYTSAVAAIEALPPSRRTNRAVNGLEEQARSAIARLRDRPDGGESVERID